MEKRRRKRKIKIKRVLLAVFILLILSGGVILLINKGKKLVINKNTMYLASDTNIVKLYILDEEDNLKEEKEISKITIK